MFTSGVIPANMLTAQKYKKMVRTGKNGVKNCSVHFIFFKNHLDFGLYKFYINNALNIKMSI